MVIKTKRGNEDSLLDIGRDGSVCAPANIGARELAAMKPAHKINRLWKWQITQLQVDTVGEASWRVPFNG